MACATPLIFAQEQPPPAGSRTVKLGNLELSPNEVRQFAVPLSSKARFEVARDKGTVQNACGALAVPDGFDPTKPWPLLIVSTSSGGSAIAAMRSFTNVALAEGWVVLAADSPHASFAEDHQDWNWAMLSSVLDYLNKAWPESKRWPVACAGFSGGAKRSALAAAQLMKQKVYVIGIFMGGCNDDLASPAFRLYHPGEPFKKIPIFLSSGDRDPIATPEQCAAVKLSLAREGFKQVRLVNYEGGHTLDARQLKLALNWFTPAYKRRTPEPATEANPK